MPMIFDALDVGLALGQDCAISPLHFSKCIPLHRLADGSSALSQLVALSGLMMIATAITQKLLFAVLSSLTSPMRISRERLRTLRATRQCHHAEAAIKLSNWIPSELWLVFSYTSICCQFLHDSSLEGCLVGGQ